MKQYQHPTQPQASRKRRNRTVLGAAIVFALALAAPAGFHLTKQADAATKASAQYAESSTSSEGVFAQHNSRIKGSTITESQAYDILDDIYKGDYRDAFVEQKPELFLKHIADDFESVTAEGNTLDADMLRQFITQRFVNHVRTIEHNVTIEDIDILPGNQISAVVTLNTLEEFRKANGEGNYLLTTIATYRDVFEKRGSIWYEIKGDQIRNQTITAPRP